MNLLISHFYGLNLHCLSYLLFFPMDLLISHFYALLDLISHLYALLDLVDDFL